MGLDDLHIRESELREILRPLLEQKLNFDSIGLYRLPRTENGNLVAGKKVFTIPNGMVWIVLSACVRNATATTFARCYFDNWSSGTNRPNVGTGYWADCLGTLNRPLVLIGGTEFTIEDQNAGAGAAYYNILYYELTIDEVFK